MIETYENPVLMRLLRGGLLEAQHRGSYCLVRNDRIVASFGGTERYYFLRSGAKFFQAVPGLLAGVVERFGLGDRELALACASHGGEELHVATARGMLARGGLDPRQLRCGTHSPLHAGTAFALSARGEVPTALHNNCSGKHSLMLLATLARGEDPGSYLDFEHPLQRDIHRTLANFAGVNAEGILRRIDGCSAPTFVMTLRDAATAFQRFAGGGAPLAKPLARAAARLATAMAAEPFLLAGTGRFCTAVATITRGRVLAKVGAEGFYGALEVATGTGLALHVDDGATPATERLVAHLLHRHGLLDRAEMEALAPFVALPRRNHAGLDVGEILLEFGA